MTLRIVHSATGGDREDPRPPEVGPLAAAPGAGKRGEPRGPRVRRRLRSARHPRRAPGAGAPALQPERRLRAVSAVRPEPGIQARIATRRCSQPGCVHTSVHPKERLRVVRPPAHCACCPCGQPCEGVRTSYPLDLLGRTARRHRRIVGGLPGRGRARRSRAGAARTAVPSMQTPFPPAGRRSP
jgi:hypothetical protein